MRKSFKILTSVLLVLCIVFSAALPSFAKDEKTNSVNDEVVTMYLCATANSLTGHVWLYFENLTNRNLELGYAVLNPHGAMCVGSLPNTLKDGGGTYYNAESYMASSPEALKAHTTSMKVNLTAEQLKSVSTQIKAKNYYNLLAYNCGNFATEIWNSVSDNHIVHIVFPALTILLMRLKGAEKGTLYIARPEISEVFKQTDSGIVKASKESFVKSYVG